MPITLMTVESENREVSISYLPEMLEGQVAVLKFRIYQSGNHASLAVAGRP